MAKQRQRVKGRRTGRPWSLNEDLTEAIVAHLEAGESDETMLAALGIATTTYYRWLTGGATADREGRDTPTRRLWQAVTRAKGRRPVAILRRLAEAGEADWRAWDAYLKHVSTRERSRALLAAERRKLEAEAALAEASASAVGASRPAMVLPSVLLGQLSGAARSELERLVTVIPTETMVGDLTPEAIAAAGTTGAA